MPDFQPDWTPPNIGGDFTMPEAVRMLGAQVRLNTRMIANVAAEHERHQHWHDAAEQEENARLRSQVQQLTDALANRGNVYLTRWLNVLTVMIAAVAVVVSLVHR